MKVLLKRFHLNGHTAEFCPGVQKLGPPHKTSSFSVGGGGGGVKGLRKRLSLNQLNHSLSFRPVLLQRYWRNVHWPGECELIWTTLPSVA